MTLRLGGFEVQAAPEVADIWFRSYVQTYLERDVRAVASIRDLATFRCFMALLASRCARCSTRRPWPRRWGERAHLTQWLSILEVTGQIILTPPYYENFGKRIVNWSFRHPKVSASLSATDVCAQ